VSPGNTDTASVVEQGSSLGGYQHRDYALAIAEAAPVVHLGASEANFIERPTTDGDDIDLSWAYPILCCTDWAVLGRDLEDLGDRYVTVSAITDPFGAYDEPLLAATFPDVCRVYKAHFVTDLAQSPDDFVAGHHRRNIRRAKASVSVERSGDPLGLVAEWIDLYEHLIGRHDIGGVQRFSPESFERQLAVPGVEVFVARLDGRAVGMLVWYVQGQVAYYHLGAYSPDGYDARASFALFDAAIDHFRNVGLGWLSLGAGAGTEVDADDGLSRFKRGWSTATKPAYFVGRVLDRDAFERLSARAEDAPAGYFPPHRHGEYS